MDIVSDILVQWFFLVWYWMIEWWIDIPNLQTVKLPSHGTYWYYNGSFEKVQSKSIDSICMNMNEWIDVSPILADLVKIRNWWVIDCS